MSRAPARLRWVPAAAGAGAALPALALAAMVVFLVAGVRSGPVDWGRLLTSPVWDPARDRYGATAMIFGTAVVSAVALLLAAPVGWAAAVAVVELAPTRWRRALQATAELLAVVPSIVYGLVGIVYLRPFVARLAGVPGGDSLLAGGLVLATMVLPTIVAVSADALDAVPATTREAAAACGLTRAEVLGSAVLPAARRGMGAAALLALARALGETIAVFLLVGRADGRFPASAGDLLTRLVRPGQTLTTKLNSPESVLAGTSGAHWAALCALGLLLLVVVVVLTGAGQWRSRAGAGAVAPTAGRLGRRAGVSSPRAEPAMAAAGVLRQVVGAGARAGGAATAGPGVALAAGEAGAVDLRPEWRGAGDVPAARRNRRAGAPRAAWPGGRARAGVDRVVRAGLWAALALVVALVAAVVVAVATRAGAALHPSFWWTPARGASGGGIRQQLAGTALLVAAAGALAAPVGLGLGLVIAEYAGGRAARWLRTLTLTLGGMPSIVLGLWGYWLFGTRLGWGKSWLAGAVVLAVLAVPPAAVAVAAAVDALPLERREAAGALGLRRHQVVRSVVVPQAVPGLVTGLLLGLARAAGETAPLLFTATVFSGAPMLPSGVRRSPVSSLPTHLFNLAQDAAEPAARRAAWGAALALMVVAGLLVLAAVPARRRLRRQAA